MHVKRLEISGSSNIGLYGYANNHVAILPPTASKSTKSTVGDVLDVPVTTVSVAGTNLIGAFLTGNNKRLLYPDIIADHEETAIKDVTTPAEPIPTTYTCLGNNVLVNDDAAVLSPEFSEAEGQRIADILEVQHATRTLASVETVGTLAVVNDATQCIVASNDITEEEYDFIGEHFDVEVTSSSVNMGASQIGCGVLCNENGLLVGKASGGPEVTRIDEGLGFA